MLDLKFMQEHNIRGLAERTLNYLIDDNSITLKKEWILSIKWLNVLFIYEYSVTLSLLNKNKIWKTYKYQWK